jgi:hypothetical protein
MGMEQMAVSKDANEVNSNSFFSNDPAPFQTWRENEYLDMFFEHVWRKISQDDESEFNGQEVDITYELLDELEEAINTDKLFKGLPSEWYNERFYNQEAYLKNYPEFRDEDLLFIAKAREELNKGRKVIYSNWK